MTDARLIKNEETQKYAVDRFFSEFTTPASADELVLGRFGTGAGFSVPPHHHTCNTVCYLVRGRAAFDVGPDLSQRIEMEPGDYAVIPAGTLHTEMTVGDDDAEFILARDKGGGDTIPLDPDNPFWK